MSDWRNSDSGSQRGHGSERNWRSRGRVQGRGRALVRTSADRGGPQMISNSPHQTPTMAPRTSNVPDVVAANRRRMNLMASVSRSSGLEKDGDDLKNHKTQEEYRIFIQEKVDDIFKNYPRSTSESESQRKQRVDAQENVLILFRKLREGVASSGRKDAFALEAYETSLYLSIIFESAKQTISVIPHLFPPMTGPEPPKYTLHLPSIFCVLISLLHHLVASYPSQSTYHQQLGFIPKDFLPPKSEISIWLTSLTRSLRMRNYAHFAVLSRQSTVADIVNASLSPTQAELEIERASAIPSNTKADSSRGLEAVLLLLDSLRTKAAETAWTVIRGAYRELACDEASAETKSWLSRSLCLESVLKHKVNVDVEDWLVARIPPGHVRRKEGLEGRWIICKVR